MVDENVLDAATCGIFSVTEDGIITNANAFCKSILEYHDGELTGKNVSTILNVSGRIFYQTHLFPLVKLHNKADEIFLNLLSKSKQIVPVVLSGVVVERKGLLQIVFSFIPVYNRRKYEDEILLARRNAENALQKNETLERVKNELETQHKALDKQISLLKFQNKELLKLSDVIAHDLQEPVRKLILFSNELQQNNTGNHFNDHALKAIKRSSQKIKNLLVNLQNYLSLTVLDKEIRKVKLPDIVKYELNQLKKSFPHIEVHEDVDMLPTIVGNRNQLSWMFHHIFKNAFEHGVADNKLYLKVTAVVIKDNLFNNLEDKYAYVDFVKITVSDNGPGFDPRFNEYIFDVLKRLDVTGPRLGFGLAFCKRIAENHFGTLRAEGRPGKGADFIITLPIDNAS